jgi:hypothetical protein
MAFRKLVGSYKDYNIATHIIEKGYLAVDVDSGSLRIGDGETAGGTEIANTSGGGGSSSSLGDLSATGSTLTAPSDGDLTLKTAGSGIVFVDDSFKVGSGATVTTILDEDNMSTDSATALATQQSIKAYVDSQSSGGTGDVSFVGATISAPSNAPLTLVSSGSSVDIEGLSVAGNVISTTDSSAGVEITGNLIPSADGVYQLGSESRRWQTVYVSAETLNVGGATISSDGTGALTIAATGATLPEGSKVSTKNIMLGGKTGATAARPTQLVNLYISDGSTSYTDAQLLAKAGNIELEFNGTVEDVPVYTEANQTFTLSNGDALADSYTGVTLFQF